ncbi:MAG: pyruvate ferredoxin oxidoreductase [Deltaproteobacteria bacterium]|nr:pyruvate ferredoxin oxidoreductase [Deltaproteobacteria bacterium]
MGNLTYMRGNQAAAEAAKLSRIEFMGAYPIPPSAEIMEAIRTFIENGELKAGFVEAEGEKSAQLACFAAACSGCRAFNATSSQGLLYMHESLPMIAGNRMPMVMVVGNRSVFAPHGMLNDHSDSVSQRDTGWLQLYCETVQELFDTVIQAFAIGEDPAVKLPVMVCEDGYWLSHSLERVRIPSQEEVDAFLPPYRPNVKDHLEPGGLGIFTSFGMMENWFTEFKYQQQVAEARALGLIDEVDARFAAGFGRSYGGVLEAYGAEGADVLVIGMGSIMATVRFTVNIVRPAGKRVGMVKVRSFRPFPKKRLAAAVAESGAKVLVVIEKTQFGALFDEVRSALYDLERRPKILGFGLGLNGRDVGPYNVIDLVEQALAAPERGDLPRESELYFVRKRELAATGDRPC